MLRSSNIRWRRGWHCTKILEWWWGNHICTTSLLQISQNNPSSYKSLHSPGAGVMEGWTGHTVAVVILRDHAHVASCDTGYKMVAGACLGNNNMTRHVPQLRKDPHKSHS